jgi:hypothetical protein
MLQSRHVLLSVCLLYFDEWWVQMILLYEKKDLMYNLKMCFIDWTLNSTSQMKKESRMRDKIRIK